MRSGRLGVDSRRVRLTNRRTEIQSANQVVEGIDVDLVQTSQDNATFGILADSDGRAFASGGLGNKEISECFIVNLPNVSFLQVCESWRDAPRRKWL